MSPIPQALFPPWSAPEGYGNSWIRNEDHTMTVLPLAVARNNGSVPLLLDDAASINAAFAQLPPGGKILLGPYTYTLLSTLSIPGATPTAPGCHLQGVRGTVLAAYFGGSGNNTGAAVSAHGSELGAANLEGYGSVISGLTIDGTNVPSTAVSTGLDVGDQYHLTVRDVTIQNFTASGNTAALQTGGSNPLGAVGMGINNQVHLSEKCHISGVTINNCTNAFQTVTTSGTSTSRMYSDIDIVVNLQPHQNGLVIARQGHLENGTFKMRGNFDTDGSTSNCAAIVCGVVGNGGSSNEQGHSFNCEVDINVETDPGGSGSTMPVTIAFGANADNTISTWRGRLQFSDGWQHTSGWISSISGQFQMSGRLHGDNTLNNVPVPWVTLVSGTVYTNNGSDALVVVTGGTVTQIAINGSNTGLTSGIFPVVMNGTIAITFSGSPVVTWITNLAS